MRILVTGGAGFIGSHLTERLLLEGHLVTVVDDLSSGNRDNLPKHSNLHFLPVSISEWANSAGLEEFDAIAHLAARPSVVDSWENALDCHERNLTATLSLLEYCRRAHISRLLIASSAAVYGETSEIPTSESSLTRPTSPYGLQKLSSEQYLQLYANEFGFVGVALRFFNVYGPRQEPTSGYSGVISIFLEAFASNRPITIHGDGRQSRDFVFVEDVIDAIFSALTSPGLATGFTVANIGTGQSVSVRELIDLLKPHFPDWKAAVETSGGRAGDIQTSRADIAQAKALFNYAPRSSLTAGLRRLVESTLCLEEDSKVSKQSTVDHASK